MHLYVLVIFVVIAFLVCLFFSRFLFSPVCLIMLSYIMSTFLILPNVDVWNVNLKETTIYIVIIGLFAFILGYFIAYIFTKKKKKELIEYEYIKILPINKLILIFFQLLTLILNIYFIQQLVGTLTLSNFGEMIGKYRIMSAYSEDLQSIPSFVSQMVKACTVIFYFVTYIFLNNFIYNKKNNNSNKKNIYVTFLISSFVQIFLSLLSGGRYNLVTCILGVVTIYTIINAKDKEKIGKSIPFKTYFKIFMIFIVVLVLFSSMRSLVGRTNENDLFTYISAYFGGSIPLFDKYLYINPPSYNEQFGYYTFFPIYRLLNMFGIVDDFRRSNFGFLTSGSLSGNVYTAFFPMYYDFGLVGVFILQLIQGFVWYKLFYKVYHDNKFKSNSIIIMMIYCLHTNCLYLHSYGESFYSFFLAQTFVLELIYIYIIYFIIFKLKIKVR